MVPCAKHGRPTDTERCRIRRPRPNIPSSVAGNRFSPYQCTNYIRIATESKARLVSDKVYSAVAVYCDTLFSVFELTTRINRIREYVWRPYNYPVIRLIGSSLITFRRLLPESLGMGNPVR